MKYGKTIIIGLLFLSFALAVGLSVETRGQRLNDLKQNSPEDALRSFAAAAARGKPFESFVSAGVNSSSPETPGPDSRVAPTPNREISPRIAAFAKRLAGEKAKLVIGRTISNANQARIRIEIEDGDVRFSKDVFLVFDDGWKVYDVAWPDESPEFAGEPAGPDVTV